jgi:hypothetical protein
MAALDDDSNALWLKHLREGKRDLLSEALLYLEAAGEHFGDAGEFGEADDAAVGDVADVHLDGWFSNRLDQTRRWTYLAHERDQMVLAQGEDLNVLHYNHLVVVLVEDSAINDVSQILLVALGEEQQGLRIALRCVQQPLTVRVLAQALQHSAYSAGQLLEICGFLLFSRLFPLPCTLARPAETVEVDSGVLSVGTMRAARRKRRLGNDALIVVFHVYLAVGGLVMPAVHGRDGAVCGEVSSRAVEVDGLAASV